LFFYRFWFIFFFNLIILFFIVFLLIIILIILLILILFLILILLLSYKFIIILNFLILHLLLLILLLIFISTFNPYKTQLHIIWIYLSAIIRSHIVQTTEHSNWYLIFKVKFKLLTQLALSSDSESFAFFGFNIHIIDNFVMCPFNFCNVIIFFYSQNSLGGLVA